MPLPAHVPWSQRVCAVALVALSGAYIAARGADALPRPLRPTLVSAGLDVTSSKPAVRRAAPAVRSHAPTASRTTAAPVAPARTSREPVVPAVTYVPDPPSVAAAAAGPRTAVQATTATWAEESAAAQWLFDKINSERAANGLPALRRDSRLDASAHQHNLAMAKANTLSHQLPGEPNAGQRMSAQGVVWTQSGENAGMSGELANSGITAASKANEAMMNEGPGGGHYDNLMGTAFDHVGVSVVYDPFNHKMWITEDFAAEA